MKNSIDKITFPEYLEWITERYKDNIAVREKEENYTYGQMKENVYKVACFLKNKGIRKKDNVIVQLKNSAVEIFTIFALFEIGAVPIMVLPAYGNNEVEGIMRVAQPVAFIGMRKFMQYEYEENIERLVENYECVREAIYEDELREALCSSEEWTFFKEEKADAGEMAILLLSGGTTGIPKLIPRTHMDYIYNGKMSAERCALTEKDVYLACMPIAHNFTLCAPGVIGTFYSGGTVVVSNETGPLEILEYIEDYEITYISLVPSLAQCCIQVLQDDSDWDLRSLRLVLVGGARLERKTAEDIVNCFSTKLMQVFGTAEGLISTTSLEDDLETILSTQGKPISPLDVIKIVDSEGNELEFGKEGELITKGPYTITEYYRLGEKNRLSFTQDGFYKTGDKACILPDGNLKILGRVREQINRAGEKIMPSEIEGHLYEMENVNDCAVVGVEDELLGAAIYACIVAEQKIEPEEVKEFLRSKGLASYKMPDQIVQMEKLPLSAFGKVDKSKLKEYIITL